MKKITGLVVLVALLMALPSVLPTGGSINPVSDAQLAAVSGSGSGCDLVEGVAWGLGIGGAFGCLACGAAGIILGAGVWAFC